MDEEKITKYIKSQKSLHLYQNIQYALKDVLDKVSPEDFTYIKENLIIMAFHEGVKGQVMHFPARREGFAVMQLYVPRDMPGNSLRNVIAHEIGHVLQKRNSEESDGDSLEIGAENYAKSLGFERTSEVDNWLNTHN